MDNRIVLETKTEQTRNAGLNFITSQKPNADAAYERLKIVRKATKDLHRAINDTDTRDMSEKHRGVYADLYAALIAAESWEQALINEGE